MLNIHVGYVIGRNNGEEKVTALQFIKILNFFSRS